MLMTTSKVDLVGGRKQVGLERKFSRISAPVEPPLAALRGLLPRGFNLVSLVKDEGICRDQPKLQVPGGLQNSCAATTDGYLSDKRSYPTASGQRSYDFLCMQLRLEVAGWVRSDTLEALQHSAY